MWNKTKETGEILQMSCLSVFSQGREMKWFKLNFGDKGTNPNRNCYECGMDEFTEGRFFTNKDIKDIGDLEVGKTWKDPGYDLRYLREKRPSSLKVRRLK